MSNSDNYEAAVIFSRIASEDVDEKYRSIALDFLQLLSLRGGLKRAELNDQPAFGILHSERRWVDLYRRLKG